MAIREKLEIGLSVSIFPWNKPNWQIYLFFLFFLVLVLTSLQHRRSSVDYGFLCKFIFLRRIWRILNFLALASIFYLTHTPYKESFIKFHKTFFMSDIVCPILRLYHLREALRNFTNLSSCLSSHWKDFLPVFRKKLQIADFFTSYILTCISISRCLYN